MLASEGQLSHGNGAGYPADRGRSTSYDRITCGYYRVAFWGARCPSSGSSLRGDYRHHERCGQAWRQRPPSTRTGRDPEEKFTGDRAPTAPRSAQTSGDVPEGQLPEQRFCGCPEGRGPDLRRSSSPTSTAWAEFVFEQRVPERHSFSSRRAEARGKQQDRQQGLQEVPGQVPGTSDGDRPEPR